MEVCEDLVWFVSGCCQRGGGGEGRKRRERTRLLCWTDSGTSGLIIRESSCAVAGILDAVGLVVRR